MKPYHVYNILFILNYIAAQVTKNNTGAIFWYIAAFLMAIMWAGSLWEDWKINQKIEK